MRGAQGRQYSLRAPAGAIRSLRQGAEEMPFVTRVNGADLLGMLPGGFNHTRSRPPLIERQ